MIRFEKSKGNKGAESSLKSLSYFSILILAKFVVNILVGTLKDITVDHELILTTESIASFHKPVTDSESCLNL